MGWWGTDIMEGDSPQDVKGEICRDLLNMGENYYELSEDEFRRVFQQQYNKKELCLKFLKEIDDNACLVDDDDPFVSARSFVQVAAYLMIKYGHLNMMHARHVVIEGRAAASHECDHCVEADGWDHPEERTAHLELFINECDFFLGDVDEEQYKKERARLLKEDKGDATHLEAHHAEQELQTKVEALIPDFVKHYFMVCEASGAETNAIEDACAEIHERIGRMLDQAGLYEAVEAALEERTAKEDEVTVTFIVNGCHNITERKAELEAELRRVQETSCIGLMLRDIEVK